MQGRPGIRWRVTTYIVVETCATVDCTMYIVCPGAGRANATYSRITVAKPEVAAS